MGHSGEGSSHFSCDKHQEYEKCSSILRAEISKLIKGLNMISSINYNLVVRMVIIPFVYTGYLFV